MSLGPSTSGFGFVLCKAFFQQLADERADVHSGGSRRASSSGSNSLADEDGGGLSSGDFHLLSARISTSFPGTLAQLQLYVMHPDGSGVRQLTLGSDGLSSLHPTWSPDSDQLLFLRGTSNSGDANIWSINGDGSHLYQVTHKPGGYGTGLALAWLP